jgi:hypothetical protein
MVVCDHTAVNAMTESRHLITSFRDLLTHDGLDLFPENSVEQTGFHGPAERGEKQGFSPPFAF